MRNKVPKNLEEAKVEISRLNHFSWEMRLESPLKGIECALEAYELALQWNHVSGIAESLRNQGVLSWFLSDYNNALVKLLSGLNYAQASDDKSLESSILNWLGNTHERLGNNAAAFDYHLKSLNLRVLLNDKIGQAASLNNLGNLHWRMSDFATALDYYQQALRIREVSNDKITIGASLNNITVVYFHLGQYQNALNYAERSIAFFEDSIDKRGFANSLSNYALCLQKSGKLEESLEYASRSLELRRVIGDRQGEANSLNNIGLVLLQKKQFDEALEKFQESLAITEKIGDRFFEAETLINIASVYSSRAAISSEMKPTKESYVTDDLIDFSTVGPLGLFDHHLLKFAVEYIEKALKVAEEIQSKQWIYESYLALSKCYKMLGNTMEALRTYKAYHEVRELVFSERNEEKIKVLNVKFEMERKKKEAEIYRLKNVELAKKNLELQNAKALRSEFLKIAATDLKDPLATITSYADMLSESIDQFDPRYPGRIKHLSINMLDLINRLLRTGMLDSGNISFTRTPISLFDLTIMILESYRNIAQEKRIEIEIKNLTKNLAICDEERTAEIIQNLLSNAIKFSYPEKKILFEIFDFDPYRPGVHAITKILADLDLIALSITDEGQGFSEEDKKNLFKRFQRLSSEPTGGEPSVGLGLAISKELAEKQGGTLYLYSEGKNAGATFTLLLPKFQTN
ncbi:MAG: tetratricopeptide repeat-containing sensor histidine kinase [Chloroherpetonaceae bacterium]|nr:tetratricopeptide repeat-containing sensor histidine kinase [Chloroherpetonaceae bacterium]